MLIQNAGNHQLIYTTSQSRRLKSTFSVLSLVCVFLSVYLNLLKSKSNKLAHPFLLRPQPILSYTHPHTHMHTNYAVFSLGASQQFQPLPSRHFLTTVVQETLELILPSLDSTTPTTTSPYPDFLRSSFLKTDPVFAVLKNYKPTVLIHSTSLAQNNTCRSFSVLRGTSCDLHRFLQYRGFRERGLCIVCGETKLIVVNCGNGGLGIQLIYDTHT